MIFNKKIFNKNKDDVFSIRLPDSDLIFTRYLYIKDEVRVALLVSILKKSDDAIFWGYELFHSGFKNEFFELIWKIYYDFFATLNPSFETYLIKKHKEWLNQGCDTVVKKIIQNLLFRPLNTDIFFLRNICQKFEVDIEYINNNNTKITDFHSFRLNMEKWIETEDYRSIAQWILNDNKNMIDLQDIYNMILDKTKNSNNDNNNKNNKNNKIYEELQNYINPNIILLTKIMTLFSKKHNLKKGRNIYFNVEPEDIVVYETIIVDDILKNYNILENACICGIDELKQLSLFKLNRYKYELNGKYWYNWLYHASFSPIWSKRIHMFKGYPDYFKKIIVFQQDNLEEEFHKLYGFEPDEQKRCVQEKSIMSIERKYDWKWFEKTYKKNGLFNIYEEELEEFDNDGINY